MEKKDIIILAVVFFGVGLSVYRRFIQKKGNANIGGKDSKSSSVFSSSSKDDDYEPYSKK
jgi:hypothetical protein